MSSASGEFEEGKKEGLRTGPQSQKDVNVLRRKARASVHTKEGDNVRATAPFTRTKTRHLY
jgi:hypothetical protein